jgi:hypothetical protein
LKTTNSKIAAAVTLLVVLSASCLTYAGFMSGESIIHSSGSINYPVSYPLHIDGGFVKDSLGNIVYLRGVNKDFLGCSEGFWMAGSNDWYTHWGVWDENVVKANLQGMKAWGINVIRICICIDWWLRNYKGTLDGQSSNMAFRDALIRTIQLAQQQGIYVDVVPWSVKAANGQAALPFPPYQGSAADVIPDVQSWVSFWLNVSRTLRPYDNVILELHNEPAGDLQVWFDAATQAINALRADGDDRIIVIQYLYCGSFDDVNWLDTWYNQSRPLHNILFSNHIYRYHGTFGGQFSPVDINYIRNTLAVNKAYLHAIKDLNAPIWVGEIGAWGAYTPDQGVTDPSVQQNEYTYFNNTLTVLNQWSVGYAVWEWFPEWGSYPGRAWGIISKSWNVTTPVTPPTPGIAGQILVDAIASGP